MNPDTNKFEELTDGREKTTAEKQMEDIQSHLSKLSTTNLLRPDGSPVPDHWTVLTLGEVVTIKTHTFEVAYINEGTLVLVPRGPVLVGGKPDEG